MSVSVDSPVAPRSSSHPAHIIDWLADRAERAGWLSFAVLSVVYWVPTLRFASRKLMWNDELYTYYMCRLPTMSDVWAALMSRGEQTPPLFYWLTRLSIRIAGNTNIGIRLPEMLGMWLLSLCLFVALRRRTSSLPALAGAALPLVTSAYPYAFEARAYGLLMGFSALTFLSWQTATMSDGSGAIGSGRTIGVIGLLVSLAATLSIHYYGLFVLVPLGLGELTRDIARRKLDVPIWIAMALAVVPLFWHLELIRAGSDYSGAFWSPPQWVNLPDFYDNLLAPAIVPTAAVIVIASVTAWWMRTTREQEPSALEMPSHELSAAIGFTLIPLFCVVTAKLVTGAFVNRYALSSIVGFGLLGGFATAIWFRRSPVLRLSAAVCVVGWFAFSAVREVVNVSGLSQPVSPLAIERSATWIRDSHRADLPVVVADAHSFAVLSHYAAPDIRPRLVYLADPAMALKYLGHNSVERGMLDLLKPYFGMNVVAFEPYIDGHREFLVIGDFWRRAFLNWLLPELQRRGKRIELLDRAGDDMLLLVGDRGADGTDARHVTQPAAPIAP